MRYKDAVDEALSRLTSRLNDAHIPYAIIGATAMAVHGLWRFTTDIDVLTTPEGLDEIHKLLVGRGYVPMFPGARKTLRDAVTNVPLDFVMSGELIGGGWKFPEPNSIAVEVDTVQVVSLAHLIELKMLSGLFATGRLRDLGDVERMIAVLAPPRTLGEMLDRSLRDEYYRIWDGIQNDPFIERPPK
jgi:hypothetical protein